MSPAAILAEPPPDTDATDDPWREKYKRWYLQMRMAYEAMMLEKIKRQNRIARDTARRAANGTLGKEAGEDDDAEEDDMATRIGDEVQHHHHYPPMPVEEKPPAPVSGGMPGWLKGVAILTVGGLLGAAAWNLLKPDKPIVTPPPASKAGLNPGGLTIEVIKDSEPEMP